MSVPHGEAKGRPVADVTDGEELSPDARSEQLRERLPGWCRPARYGFL